MRLLKAQNTNLRTIYGKGVQYDTTDQVVLDSTNSVRVPKGTTAQRPSTSVNGQLRYNTDDERFEMHEDGEWLAVRSASPAAVVQQSLGNGDASEVYFGPLNNQDTDYPVPASAESMIVLVENVFQIASTNYSLVQNPPGKTAGYYIQFTSAPDLGKPVTVLHNFDK